MTLFTALALCLAAHAVSAQGVPESVVPPILQLSFSNPGARSMGLGGAFVALADDATAAFANRATAASELIERALLPTGADKIHWSFGIGLAFEHSQIDLGVDFSDFVDTVSLSAIYSF